MRLRNTHLQTHTDTVTFIFSKNVQVCVCVLLCVEQSVLSANGKKHFSDVMSLVLTDKDDKGLLESLTESSGKEKHIMWEDP